MEKSELMPNKKESYFAALIDAKDDAEFEVALIENGMNKNNPDDVTTRLMEPRDIGGTIMTLDDYSNNLKNKYPDYKPGRTAKNGQDRVLPDQSDLVKDPITGKMVHEMYYVPGSKQRTVTDAEVDAVWDKISKEEGGKELLTTLFSLDKGSPGRNPPDRSKLDYDRSSNGPERLKKAQMKALLEQMIEVNGQPEIHDPWEPDGIMKDFPDLDHIVPLAVGGTHGVPVDSLIPPTTGYHSDNFVWIGKRVNQHYKKDGTIPDTVNQMRVEAVTTDKDEYNKFKEYEDWEATSDETRAEADKKWATYDGLVSSSRERKLEEMQDYEFLKRITDRSDDMPSSEEFIDLMVNSDDKRKEGFRKRALDGLSNLGAIDKALKTNLRNADLSEQTILQIGDLLQKAKEDSDARNITQRLK